MNWLHHIWFGYFVPSLWGNGPEALVQTVVYGGIVLLIVPPWRRWALRHLKGIKEHVTEAVGSIHAKLDAHHSARAAAEGLLHAKLDHIIKHHPDIPDFPGAEPAKARRSRKAADAS